MNYNTAFGNYVKILNAVFLCKKILFQLSLYVLGQKRARKWKKPRCGCKKRKANKKTHLESLLRSPRAETGRGSREVSWKTRGVGVGEQKQARYPTPEANREVPERKLGVEVGKQAGNPMLWVWEEKSKLEKPKQKTNRNPPRKLVKSFRGELIYNKKASWILIKLKST